MRVSALIVDPIPFILAAIFFPGHPYQNSCINRFDKHFSVSFPNAASVLCITTNTLVQKVYSQNI